MGGCGAAAAARPCVLYYAFCSRRTWQERAEGSGPPVERGTAASFRGIGGGRGERRAAGSSRAYAWGFGRGTCVLAVVVLRARRGVYNICQRNKIKKSREKRNRPEICCSYSSTTAWKPGRRRASRVPHRSAASCRLCNYNPPFYF